MEDYKYFNFEEATKEQQEYIEKYFKNDIDNAKDNYEFDKIAAQIILEVLGVETEYASFSDEVSIYYREKEDDTDWDAILCDDPMDIAKERALTNEVKYGYFSYN